MDLRYIINTDSFQIIQDDIADATEIAIITVDYRGTPVTNHSRCSEFCQAIRANKAYSQLCEKCDSRGGLEAARLEKPYIYICHAGLVDFAAPIIVGNTYLGAVMAGQVLLPQEDQEKLEQIVNERQVVLDLEENLELARLFKKLPTMSLEKVEAISRMMFHLSNYLVEESLLKISLNEFNQGVQSPVETKTRHEETREDIIEEGNHQVYRGNIILKPAMEYIHKNYGENITMKDMAQICNISSSYFSKLFRREVEDSFPNYVNRVKIARAKEMIRETDMPIINVSLDLGFTDCGYFIKVFKRLVGVTPAVYRQEELRKGNS